MFDWKYSNWFYEKSNSIKPKICWFLPSTLPCEIFCEIKDVWKTSKFHSSTNKYFVKSTLRGNYGKLSRSHVDSCDKNFVKATFLLEKLVIGLIGSWFHEIFFSERLWPCACVHIYVRIHNFYFSTPCSSNVSWNWSTASVHTVEFTKFLYHGFLKNFRENNFFSKKFYCKMDFTK